MLSGARHDAILRREGSALFVVDMQEAFRNHIADFSRVTSAIQLLLRAATKLGVPVAWSEQYPQGLGVTIPELRELLPADGVPVEKLRFAACDTPGWDELPVAVRDARQFVLVGIEAHVCVRQTALALVAAGRDVHVPVDAVASSAALRCDTALSGLERAGVRMATVEQVLFDWLEEAGTPEFRDVQALLKQYAAES